MRAIHDGLTKEQRYYQNHKNDTEWKKRRNDQDRAEYRDRAGERKRERRWRHRSRRRKEEQSLRRSGISIITARDLVGDRIKLAKNQTRYRSEIERLATEILASRETMAQAQEKCDQIEARYQKLRASQDRRRKTNPCPTP